MRKRTLRRAIAIFLLLVTVGNVVAPTVSYALTSGPTAPEATSFEPVDTTDMVSLLTGDLTYNMGLLEVPGPSGSYPLSLSYHAGIQPNEDASWMGLGWTLNPGAITRLTNGVPDDFDGTATSNRAYWEGGETTVNTVGLAFNIGIASVSAGLSFSQDTYKGSGIGGSIGVSVGPKISLGGFSASAGINASVGISPYGGMSASVGIGIRIHTTAKGIGANASIGLSLNSAGSLGGSMSGGINTVKEGEKGPVFGRSMMEASIATSGGGASMSVAGFTSSANNSKEGTISTSEDSWSVSLPLLPIEFGRTHIRYWMDETVGLKNFGALNYPINEQPDNKNNVYDTYHIQGENSIKDGKNPERYLEGSFADYDQYNVNAQGLSGNIRPHHYILSLYGQDVINEAEGTKDILNYNIPQHAVGVHFRFINDFSNRIVNNPSDIEVNKTYTQSYWQTQDPSPDINEWKGRIRNELDDPNTTTGGQVTTTSIIPLFFPYNTPQIGQENAQQKRVLPNVPGSKHVEYFTNKQINDYKNALINTSNNQSIDPSLDLRPKKFIESNSKGFGRTTADGDGKIGAFTITNQSGVNYHFSLPAYSYDEYTYSGAYDDKGKLSFNVVSQSGKYAYTWYLTGMTGPDYVDRGPNGIPDNILNDYDWGYWVDFQYGKWTDNYQWRNPADGFNQDINHRVQSFSIGKKELYYLNAIRTKTHTALFIKELRADAKGLDPINYPVPQNIPNDGGKFNLFPKASLGLKAIKLYKNVDLPNLETLYSSGSSYNHGYVSVNNWSNCYYLSSYPYPLSCGTFERIHFGENVLDVGDALYYYSPIRSIEFDFDYSLSPGTFNSFDLNYPIGNLYYCLSGESPPTNLQPQPQQVTMIGSYVSGQKKGKLTLKSVTFKGKNGVEFLPPSKFYYDLSEKENSSGTINSLNSASKSGYISLNSYANQFEEGDLITFNQNNKSYYGYMLSNGTTIKFISDLPVIGTFTNFSKTKNPPYNKDFVDVWGMYKSDYQDLVGSHLTHYPSNISVKNSDVWSLREIQNSTGSITKIEYESDTYGESVFENLTAKLEPSTYVTYCGDLNNPNPEIYPVAVTCKVVTPPNVTFDFLKRYSVGEQINIAADIRKKVNNPNVAPSYYTTQAYNATVISVSRDELILSSCIGVFVSGGIYEEATFERGKVSLKSSYLSYGGGIRVKKLSLIGATTNELSSTQYQYDFNNKSSGVTSYEPVSQYIDDKLVAAFNQDIIINTLALARDMPSPGVFYKKVRVSETNSNLNESTISIPGYSEYNFEVFNKEMINSDKNTINAAPSTGTHKTVNYQNTNTRRVVLRDFTQRVGKLKSVALFDKDERKINETINHYLHDEQSNQTFTTNSTQYPILLDRFNKQGVIHETFNHARVVKNTTGSGYTLQGLISKKENYPAIQTGTTSINYKTGIKTESKTLAFDFYNGNVSKTLEVDGYGNSFITDIDYAYNIYPGMGLKSEYFTYPNTNHPEAINNKHMIDQQAAATTYKVVSPTDLTPLSIVSASAQTWSDQIPVMGVAGNNQTGLQTNIWRKKSTFSYTGNQYAPLATTGDGLVAVASFQPFANWTSDASQAGWQKNATITKYDYNSHAIEATDVNDKYAATKFSYDHSQILATAANANYGELAYSGVEEPLQQDQFYHATNFPFKAVGGGVYVSDESTLSSTAHTGVKSVQTPIGKKAFRYSFDAENKNYQVSVWGSRNDAKIKYKLNNGSTLEAVMEGAKKSGDWYLLTGSISTGATGTLEIWCEAGAATTLFDDFRMHPVQAAMTSYVYNNWGELTHILDNNNIYTKYEYDGMGRLTKTYRERLQSNTETPSVSKISEVDYHYALKSQLPVFMVPIQTSVVSGNGSITQNVSVLPGGTATINAINSCENLSYLSRIYADGKLLSQPGSGPFAGPVTLYDGAKAYLENGVVKLAGVQGSHKVKVEFALPPTNLQPYAVCEWSQPNNCPTNRYFILTPNGCGGYDQSNITYLWTQLSPAIQANTSPCPTIDPNSNCNQLQQQN